MCFSVRAAGLSSEEVAPDADAAPLDGPNGPPVTRLTVSAAEDEDEADMVDDDDDDDDEEEEEEEEEEVAVVVVASKLLLNVELDVMWAAKDALLLMLLL